MLTMQGIMDSLEAIHGPLAMECERCYFQNKEQAN